MSNLVDILLAQKLSGGGSGGGAVDSVNGKTGAVVLDASDVGALPDTTSAAAIGAIPAPSGATAGQFLVYNGSAWVATTVPNANGGSF